MHFIYWAVALIQSKFDVWQNTFQLVKELTDRVESAVISTMGLETSANSCKR